MTHTRTHTYVTFANPYLICEECRQPVPRWHDARKCGCTGSAWLEPCGHLAAATSVCPSWSPVDGCQCRRYGVVSHPAAGPAA